MTGRGIGKAEIPLSNQGTQVSLTALHFHQPGESINHGSLTGQLLNGLDVHRYLLKGQAML